MEPLSVAQGVLNKPLQVSSSQTGNCTVVSLRRGGWSGAGLVGGWSGSISQRCMDSVASNTVDPCGSLWINWIETSQRVD